MFGIQRPSTRSDHQDRMNRVLVYIQEHLDQVLTLEKLAGVACFSVFHFHRIFNAFIGESLSGYVRRLRLERAANRLKHGKGSVTDIGYDAGYGTPNAFTKAFRAHFGMSPMEYRERPSAMPPIPPAHIPFLRETLMDAEIKTLEPKDVIFVRRTGSYQDAAPEAWGAIMSYAYGNRLMQKETELLGLCHDNPDVTDEGKIRYDACITVGKPVSPSGEIGRQTIAGGTYAVFLHKGSYENLHATYQTIYAGWLPENGYEHRNAPCFEKYLNRDPRRTKPENLRTEIYVPVERS